MLSALTPYKWLIEALALAALIAGISLGVHEFLTHERDIGRAEVQGRWDAQIAADRQAAATKKQDDDKRALEAQNAATLRDQQMQDLSSALSVTSGSLRDIIAAKRAGLSGANADAVRKTADALAGILTDCQGKYGEMAAVADRHASDVKTLTDAWPR